MINKCMSSALFRQYINILVENDDPNQPESPSRRNFLKGLGAVAAAAAMPNTANTILKQDFDFAKKIGLQIISQDPSLLIAKMNTADQASKVVKYYKARWDTINPFWGKMYVARGLYLVVTADSENGKKYVYQTFTDPHGYDNDNYLFDINDRYAKPNELKRLRSFADFKDFERNVVGKLKIEYPRRPDNILKTVGKSLKTASNVSQSANEISRLASLAGIAAPMNKQDDNNDNITAPPDAEFGDIDDNDQEELTALPPPSDPEFDFKTRIKTPAKEPIKR